MIRSRKNAGFTLIELMIVVAIIAIIASIAIPKLMSARLAANESAAIATLRSISSSQAQLQSSGAIDCDADGGGEYGFFGELSGVDPMRISDNAQPNPAPQAGAAGIDELSPSILASAFGQVNGTVVTRSGYVFKMFLPGATVGGLTPAVEELATGGSDPANFPDPDNAEVFWACYAWPLDYQSSGNRVFFVNQEGDLLQCNNRQANTYETTLPASWPAFDEAFTVAGDMSSALRIGVAGGNDNTVWTAVQ